MKKAPEIQDLICSCCHQSVIQISLIQNCIIYLLFVGMIVCVSEVNYYVKLFPLNSLLLSFVVRAFTNGVMGYQIDPSWVDPLSYFSF